MKVVFLACSRVIDGYAIFAWWLRYVPNETRNYHVLQKDPANQEYRNGKQNHHLNENQVN